VAVTPGGMAKGRKAHAGSLRSVVIIGSSGFLGSHLRQRLAMGKSPPAIFEFNSRGECQAEFEELLKRAKPDAIFHMAGVVASSDPQELNEGNVLHLERMLKGTMNKAPPALFIAMGSSAVYGICRKLPISESAPLAPITPYGVSMQARSTLLESYSRRGLATIEARLFNVIGPGISEKTSVGSFLKQIAAIRAGKAPAVLKTGYLGNKRDFIDVRDAVEALVRLSEKQPKSQRIFNLCSGHSVPMQEVVEKMIQLSGVDISLQTEAQRVQKSDMPDNLGDNHLLKKETGWAPSYPLDKSLEFALKKTILSA